MPRIVDEDGRREFPFPPMDSPRTSSSGGSSLQPSSASSRSKSLRSPSTSFTSHPPPRVRAERDSRQDTLSDLHQKLLAHIAPREQPGSRSLRTALAITTERLESETRRADDAERRVLEVLRKLRAAHEATMLAQAEASRAKEELTLYKFRLDEAQREILRAQEAVNDLEQAKLEAESDAARARSTARRYREQQLIARAREEGRQEGLQEGYSRGTTIGYEEAAVADRPRERRYAAPTVEDVPEEEEDEEEPRMQRYRAGTPGPAEILVRTPVPEFRNRTPGPFIIPSGRVTPPQPQPRRPPSRLSASRASERTHVPDTAHHAPILPVPTMATPLNLPSPSHSRAQTPTGMPIAHPAPRSLDSGSIPPPRPIRERTPSPTHPPVELPPDGWIPYASGPNEDIFLPPPHELSRPLSSVAESPTPPPPPVLHRAEPAQPYASTSTAPPPPPQIVSRGYPNVPPEGIPVTRSNGSKPMSPQSKASTTISQFDLTSRAPSRTKPRVSTWSRAPREDRQVMSPRGPRPREDLPAPVRPPSRQDSRGSDRSERSERERSKSSMNPLEKLFKKRYRDKSYKESPPMPHPVVPDIIVESPSTPSTNRSSIRTTATHPAFLSPELAPQSLAPLAPQDPNIIVMRTEIPGYHPSIPIDQQYVPPRPESVSQEAVIPPPGDQFPPGFVPMTPPMPTDPIPVPSNTPVPVPPPTNPIPVPANTPVPIPPPSNPVLVPYREATPVRVAYDAPLPVPQNEALSVAQRSRTESPRRARYDEAPIPAGVVYPEPPSRRSGTPSSSLSPKSRRGRPDVRSPGANLSPLPIHFQFFAPLKSDTTSESLRL
ncbi:hypothetical protein DICSQDRAFT_181647 [Dichomitus squalens LYAD-421 SS1]|uniref:Uncharacterized protein n=2 Tax=Dichomitus squalens TaxID=114155 RepID=A0A4Q9PTX3_9APHY|nr:uncharacterized protein DICSQDRAFT_181647 [Dichomitus squalens LYAD-421 SS1]EJF59865.1 hypothetical protein DICSQDRAFT_181647 [Dichomitus squalens LYAD-421 SS1]TBU57880.1 hypothetical protein BD310DRAFT_949062 [Dichomitus squalens]